MDGLGIESTEYQDPCRWSPGGSSLTESLSEPCWVARLQRKQLAYAHQP